MNRKEIRWFFTLIMTVLVIILPALGEKDQAAYWTAIVDGRNIDRVNLRELPSMESKSLGLYFTGTEVLCGSNPGEEWVMVTIGSQSGYIKSENLYRGTDPLTIELKLQTAVVDTKNASGWINMHHESSLDAEVTCIFYHGDVVTVLGETFDHWYYVKAGDLYGYMVSDDLLINSCVSTDRSSTPSASATLPELPDEFIFSSGVGAWRTVVSVKPNGQFTGVFNDSDIGDAEDSYPEGTVHRCVFSGAFTQIKKISDYEYLMKIEYIKKAESAEKQTLSNGFRVISANPYGFDNACEFRLYLPGRSTADLTEDFVSWVAAPLDWHGIPSELPIFGLYNVVGQEGFFGNPGGSWAEALESVKLITFTVPLPMDESWELGETEAEGVVETGLPEGYCLGDLWKGDQQYDAVYRLDGKGGQEILFMLDANDESVDGLNYVQNSYELSGQKYLYFMIINGINSHGSLYYYDLDESSLKLAFGEPCSNNMVFLKDAPEDLHGMGFLLHGDSILAVDLKSAQAIESATVSIETLGGLNEIGGSFFTGSIKEGERKYTYLTVEDACRIQLNTIVVNHNDYSVLHKTCCLYDVQTRQIVDIWEKDGEI